MKIVNHRLYRDDELPCAFQASPNIGGRLKPEYLVMHYTAAPSVESSIASFLNPASRASAHLVIGRDGTITQFVPFDTVALHAGQSVWEGRRGLNLYSIGIELDNAGLLQRHGQRWRAWFGREYEEQDVLEAAHKTGSRVQGWHLYTQAQIEAAVEAGRLLAERYQLRDIAGHDDIAPKRKWDPGPAFPMDSFRSQVLGRAEDAVRFRATSALNIRSGPGTEHPAIPGSPLPRGTPVEVLDQQGIWRQVDVLAPVNGIPDVVGWVHSRYLERTSPVQIIPA